ncbi:hypothetical protein T12_11956, partial [Trichinella patagoniensis]
LTVVLRALFVLVTNKLSLFIALSNNDNQRGTVLLNEFNNNNAQANDLLHRSATQIFDLVFARSQLLAFVQRNI